MSNEDRKLLDDLRAKSVEAAADMMSGLQRLKHLHEEIVGEDLEADRLKIGDFLYRLARLELEHASNILSLGNTQAEMLFEQVRRLARRARRGGAAPQKVLELALAPGDDVAASTFEVRNPFDRDADARFTIAALRRPDGTEDAGLRITARCDGPLVPHMTAGVVVEVAGAGGLAEGDVRFSEITVFLSAEVELEVAHRLIKLKVRRPEHAR